jgi:hypothetical protein
MALAGSTTADLSELQVGVRPASAALIAASRTLAL